MSRYQKGKTTLDFIEARDSEWQWHQLGNMQVCTLLQTDNHASTPPISFLQVGCPSCRPTNSVKALKTLQEAQLSPRDRAMRRVNRNLANCHSTVQKLLIRQVLTKSMVRSWRFSRSQCVIDNVHSNMTRPSLSLSQMCHKQTDDGRLVDITCIPTTCCGEIF